MEFIPIIVLSLVLVISISLHEYAHAYSSVALGDPTPHLQGRNTPNPIKHIDPIGFLAIFIIHFGRGRPVITNPSYYKYPLRDELIVALAGPFMNFVLAFVGVLVAIIYALFVDGLTPSQIALNSFFPAMSEIAVQYKQGMSLPYIFWYTFAFYNIALGVFNLIPFPPLDGYRIVQFLFPPVGIFFRKYYTYISFAVIGVIILGGRFIGPYIFDTTMSLFRLLLGILLSLF